MIMQRILLEKFGFLDHGTADALMEDGIAKAFGRKGQDVVDKNVKAFKKAITALKRVAVPDAVDGLPEPTARADSDKVTGQRRVPRSDTGTRYRGPRQRSPGQRLLSVRSRRRQTYGQLEGFGPKLCHALAEVRATEVQRLRGLCVYVSNRRRPRSVQRSFAVRAE